jgi:hypothetical protein
MSELSMTPRNNSKALTSMICGITGWVIWLATLCFNLTLGWIITAATLGLASLCLIPLGCLPLIAWLVAIITGHMGMSEIRRTGENGRGMAISGVVMGYVGLGLTLAAICVITILIATGASVGIFDEILRNLDIQY